MVSDPSNFDDRFRASTLATSKQEGERHTQHRGCPGYPDCSPGSTRYRLLTLAHEIFHGAVERFTTNSLGHRFALVILRLAGPLTTLPAASARIATAVTTTMR